MMEIFDKHQVSFVSVTQQINTATSMGRLMLNVLLSFAQFEREIIGERTRDKIAAARRKGKWAGGHPLLGYDVDPQRFKLVVNEDEAASSPGHLRAVPGTRRSLIPVVQELERRGWPTSAGRPAKDASVAASRSPRPSLHKLLTNVTYIGKVRYKNEIHDGEHAGHRRPRSLATGQAMLASATGAPAARWFATSSAPCSRASFGACRAAAP